MTAPKLKPVVPRSTDTPRAPRRRTPSISGVRFIDTADEGVACVPPHSEQPAQSGPVSYPARIPSTADETRAYSRADMTHLALATDRDPTRDDDMTRTFASPVGANDSLVPAKIRPNTSTGATAGRASHAGMAASKPAASGASTAVEAPRTRVGKRRNTAVRALWGTTIVLSIGLAAFWLALPTPQPLAPTASQAAVPADISLTLSAMPKEAIFSLDGQRLTNPFRLMRPRDGKTHQLKAEAPGYLPLTIPIRFDRDATVSVDLERASR